MTVQRYVSDELTHFVGRSFRHEYNAHEQQYRLLVDILRGGVLGKKSGTGFVHRPEASFSDNAYYRTEMVCFSDIPVPDLGIHMGKFSRFGLAFNKSLLIKRGANPVFYVAKNSVVKEGGQEVSRAELFDRFHERVWRFFGQEGEAGCQDREMMDFLAKQVFGYVKFYDNGLASDDDKNFYMEREWRVNGNLEFTLGEVRRVIFPERFARSFRQDVPEYFGEITFS